MTQRQRCMHHLNHSGGEGQRCADNAVKGAVLCARHRDEGLRRVAANLNALAIARQGLRWGTVVARGTM